ncbi:hypothetical protein EDC14_102910 [Hydrogenispora ethanolica]|uniref:Uncharacterized protein n=2 Tax=Hydrogenispora ethanolica TaxID=1082276 RepID=A0A4R1R8J5_HYDET|nr:hypothetical protein EDC14_102910 [Hydrogenispora ethanolica]
MGLMRGPAVAPLFRRSWREFVRAWQFFAAVRKDLRRLRKKFRRSRKEFLSAWQEFLRSRRTVLSFRKEFPPRRQDCLGIIRRPAPYFLLDL